MAEKSAPENGSPNLVAFAGRAQQQPATQAARVEQMVRFDRIELSIILSVYGRHVSSGDWRDYALDHLKDRALFSIFRHTSERPLYVIEKNPKLRNRQGMYQLTGQDGRVLKRGHDLRQVLRQLDPALALVR